jgi:hypothetical protein
MKAKLTGVSTSPLRRAEKIIVGLENTMSLARRVTLSHKGTPFCLRDECNDIVTFICYEKCRPGKKIVRTVITTPWTHPYPVLPTHHTTFPRLDRCLVRYGCDALGLVVLEADSSLALGRDREALQVYVDALGLGLLPLEGILLNTPDEVVPGSRVLDVFETDVDALLHVSVADLLLPVQLLDLDRNSGL